MHKGNPKGRGGAYRCLQGTKVVIAGRGLPVCLQEQLSCLRRRLDYFPIKEQTICPVPNGTTGFAVSGPISAH